MVDVSFYMLVEEEGSFSLALYDSEKNVISIIVKIYFFILSPFAPIGVVLTFA